MNYRRFKNILIEKYRCIFFVIPKNACSSMKAQIIEVLKLEKGPHYPNDVHEPTIYPYPFVKTEELNNQYQNYLRFCIARNPWDRLVSSFKDKIHAADNTVEGYKDGVALPLLKYGSLFYGGMSFDAYVESVCNIPDSEADHHFSSQLFQIIDTSGNLLVNYIGKLETLNKNLVEIHRLSGFPVSLFPHLRKTGRKNYQEYYTEELIEKVRKRFIEDISFFDYKFGQPSELVEIGFIHEKMKETLSNSIWLRSMVIEKCRKKALPDRYNKDIVD